MLSLSSSHERPTSGGASASVSRVYSAGYSLPEAAAACRGLSKRLADPLAGRTVDRRKTAHARSRRASPGTPTAHLVSHPPVAAAAAAPGLQRGPSGVAAGGAGGAARGEPRSAGLPPPPSSAGRRGVGRGEGRTAAGVAGEAEREGRESEEATGSMLSCDVRSRTVSWFFSTQLHGGRRGGREAVRGGA